MPMPKKMLRITVTQEETYKFLVPAEVVAEHRATHYAEREPNRDPDAGRPAEVFAEERAYALRNPSQLTDWAANNMNWSDLEDHAIEVVTDDEGELDMNTLYRDADLDVVDEVEPLLPGASAVADPMESVRLTYADIRALLIQIREYVYTDRRELHNSSAWHILNRAFNTMQSYPEELAWLQDYLALHPKSAADVGPRFAKPAPEAKP